MILTLGIVLVISFFQETIMKNTGIIFCILIFLIGAFIPARPVLSNIYGSVQPQNAATKVLAINAKDTLAFVPVEGKFAIPVSGGTWKLFIQTSKPFKDVTLKNIQVAERRSTDVGVIRISSGY